jgi:predicted signal transduction protein with EAL and GGDEF domain
MRCRAATAIALAVLGDASRKSAMCSRTPHGGHELERAGAAGASLLRSALLSPDGYPLGTLACWLTSPAAERAAAQHAAAAGTPGDGADRNAAQAELARVLQERELLATTDELTGLHNRRSLQQKLTFEVARARRFRSHCRC